MMMLFEWWYDLPWWARYGIALLMILISTAMLFIGRLFIWGWVVGLIMVAMGGRSQAEKNGYRRY